jgi:hypothetical protein
MSKVNRNLLLVVAVLFLLSALTYRQTIGRADRFQRGQLFLANLNPDDIGSISVAKTGEKVTLYRQGERFLVAEKQDYPASNSSVNKLLRDLLEIGLEREVGQGEDLQAELGIEPMAEESVEVILSSANDEEMVRLRVGKTFEEGPGHYVERFGVQDSGVFLTSQNVQISTDASSYLDKQIVDHDRSMVRRVSGGDFTLERSAGDGDLELTALPSGRSPRSTEIGRMASALSGLRYDDVFVADDDRVRDLEFSRILEFSLTDGSGYVLSLAERDDKAYLRIAGTHEVQQVAITVDESEEELQEKAEMLSRADEIDAFNGFHGS